MVANFHSAVAPTRSLPRFLSHANPLFPALFSTVPAVSAIPEVAVEQAVLLDGIGLDDNKEKDTQQQQQQNGKRFLFPKKGQQLEMHCESLAFKGKGVCKVVESGFVVLCDRALPGERLVGRITKKKGSYAEAMKIETLSPHDDAVVPPCEYANDCGGCKMQNLSYEAQLAAKEKQVFELISRIGRFGDGYGSFMKGILGCQSPFAYRNKVLERVQHFCERHMNEMPPYDTSDHTGFFKHLIIRSGREPKTHALQLMVNLVTSKYEPVLLQPLVKELVTDVSEVVSVVNNVNSRIGNTSVGEEEHILYGSATITECINGLVFEISANSFFQTNPRQAEILYGLVEAAAGLKGNGDEIVLDLFCGTGTIGLTLARRAKHVYGYEVVPEAVADARKNAIRNDITNATFIQGDLNKIHKCFGDQLSQPDVVIIDPNRPGMHPDLIKFLLKLRSKRIIYVSCNPATCARDLDYLAHGLPGTTVTGAYKLLSVQPVDMFPHTPHIECVCALELT